MAYAKTDATVLGFLGRALSLELTAVQQFLTLSRLLKLRGFEKAAAQFQLEAQEEIGHADRIIGRMLVLGVAPNATQLRPARLGNSLPELVASAQTLEREIIHFYQLAVAHCSRVEDFDNRLFFEQLLQDEHQHRHGLDNWQKTYLGDNAKIQ